tara:strand:- start:6263 stop:7006 length:744 start_codon:yes stop_codon:yes gene_type:complete
MSILLGNPYIDKICSKKTFTSSFVKKRILNDLKKILENLGINVIQIENNILCNVLWMRDIFFKIDNKIFLSNLNKERHHETNLVVEYLKKYIEIPQHINIEGGDIIQDKNTIFIGINERTNIAAYNYLKKMFPKKNVIKINHTALHLDCCFTVLNKNIFYSKTYINSLPNNLKNHYTISTIEDILDDIDPNNALNLLIIDKNIITTDTPEFEPFRIKLNNIGYNVFTIKYNNLLEDGGGIRCLTQYL